MASHKMIAEHWFGGLGMFYQKTVMTILLQWDYGDRSRGESGSKVWFYNNLLKLTRKVEPLWFDDYVNSNYGELQHKIIEVVEKVQPDIVFVLLNRDQISKETLNYLKSRYTLIGWFGDDHWRYESFSRFYAPYFSYVVTTDHFALEKYKLSHTNAVLSEWAAEPRDGMGSPIERESDFRYDVTFIGGANPVRRWLIKQLSKAGVKVECFGSGWPNGRVDYHQMDQIFRYSRINLNLSNSVPDDIRFIIGSISNFILWIRASKRREQVKARNFEIPLAGGFQLTNYVAGIERSWVIGQELAAYGSIDECVSQIKFYLANPSLRVKIAQSGYRRAKREHTYIRRLENILKVVSN